MTDPKAHTMTKTQDADETGFELWECDTCIRKMKVRWFPWRMLVLIRGDMDVCHKGFTEIDPSLFTEAE